MKRHLKTQLFVLFGVGAWLLLSIVVIAACYCLHKSGEDLIHQSQSLMIQQIGRRLLSSTELFNVAGRAQFCEESIQIIVESVRDRIVGYTPSSSSSSSSNPNNNTNTQWEDTQQYVPFEAILSSNNNNTNTSRREERRRMYPLNQPPVPLDWEIVHDLDPAANTNDNDNTTKGKMGNSSSSVALDSRLQKYPYAIASTRTASYHIPGTGPHNTKKFDLALERDGLYQATGDVSVIIKAMWEVFPELLGIRIHFFNNGIGTTLQYPAVIPPVHDDNRTGSHRMSQYVSDGCDWMTQLVNPYTGKRYANKATHQCSHPRGTFVSNVETNSMEASVYAVRKTVEYTSMRFEQAQKQQLQKQQQQKQDASSSSSLLTNKTITDINDEGFINNQDGIRSEHYINGYNYSNIHDDEDNDDNEDGHNNNSDDTTTKNSIPDDTQRRKRQTVQDHLVHWNGPLRSPSDNQTSIFTASKAIYDRLTNEFIGVVTMEILETGLSYDLERRTMDKDSDVYSVLYTNGIIIGTTPNAPSKVFEILPEYTELYDWLQRDYYDRIPLWEDWKLNQSQPEPERFVKYFTRSIDGGYLAAVPAPPLPKYPWLNPGYIPVAFNVQKIKPTVLREFHEFEDRVNQDVRKNIIVCVFSGFLGLIIALSILACVSRVLTQPLEWITKVARKIIHNNDTAASAPSTTVTATSDRGTRRNTNYRCSHGKKKTKKKKRHLTMNQGMSTTSMKYCSDEIIVDGTSDAENVAGFNDHHDFGYNNDIIDCSSNGADEKDDDDEEEKVDSFVNFDYYPSLDKEDSKRRCTPSTELQQLLESFHSMIHEFSGDGVSEVAEAGFCEIKNTITWHNEFAKLYDLKGTAKSKPIRQRSDATRETSFSLSSRSSLFDDLPDFQSQPVKRNNAVDGSNNTDRVILPSSIQQQQHHQQQLLQLQRIDSETSLQDNDVYISTNNCRGSISSITPNRIDGIDGDKQSIGDVEKQPDNYRHENRYACQQNGPHQQNLNHHEDQSMHKQSLMGSHSSMDISLPGPPQGTTRTIVPGPIKINVCSTLGTPYKFDPRPDLQEEEGTLKKFTVASHSKLFWWIVLLMAMPMIITNTIIGSIVSSTILQTLPMAWKDSAKQLSNSIEMDTLQQIADRKAAIMGNMLRAPARDVYLVSRISNWLLFGGIQRSNALIDVDSSSEECKDYSEKKCAHCTCNWEYQKTCNTSVNVTDSRYLQRQWFEVQRLDSGRTTGSRWSSPSFPTYLHSPETTLWWRNISELPGHTEDYTDATGYESVFDQVVVSSANSVINFPIYNYANGLRRETISYGGYLSFADNGLMMGWSGCNNWHANVSNFVSSYDNGASLIDTNLCANGKYGYDPRCRSWYAQGRKNYLHSNQPAHITPLYKFALRDQIAQTITSPLANPKTGEYIGQAVLDFKVNYERILKMIPDENPLAFMITLTEDILGGDTVVSPLNENGWSSAKIGDFLFPNEPDTYNREHFEEHVLPRMKAGERGNTSFLYTKEDGHEEKICLYFSPVKIPLVLGTSPDDFSAGTTNTSYHTIYSLGAGRPCNEIKSSYDGVEDILKEELMLISLQRLFAVIIRSSTLLFVIFSIAAATYIAFPMIKLSSIVTSTRKGEYDSIPPLEGGCKEVQDVYTTFAKLNKIIKVSNTSFFLGNLHMAHHFVSDALMLYRKINDRKAIGVTCNNLANTLFALRYEQKDEVHCCDSQLKDSCFIHQALCLYNESVNYSQQDFDHSEEGDIKVNYGIQLADRLFNRGLYFLFIDGYECAPDNSRERGYNDITYSRDLHYDIREYLVEKKQLFSNASSYFSRLLRRINCLAAFYDDVGLRQIWDAKTLLDEADRLARAASTVYSRGRCCPFFHEVQRSGRQQQLEGLQILIAMNSGENVMAAKIGLRMLVEDSFLLESSFVLSARALLRFMKENESDDLLDNDDEYNATSFSARTIRYVQDDLGAMIKSCKKESLDTGKNSVFVFELCPFENSNSYSALLDVLNDQCLELYDEYFSFDDQIGIVANNVNGEQSVEIGKKEENEGRHRTFVDVATSTYSPSSISNDGRMPNKTSGENMFPIGLQMLIDSSVSLQSDSYIVWIVDGYTRYESRTMISLQNQIKRVNKERCYQINVLVIDLYNNNNKKSDNIIADVDDENARQQQKELLEEIGIVSKNSMYTNATSEEELRRAFLSIGSILSNKPTSQFISFLTMEKF